LSVDDRERHLERFAGARRQLQPREQRPALARQQRPRPDDAMVKQKRMNPLLPRGVLVNQRLALRPKRSRQFHS